MQRNSRSSIAGLLVLLSITFGSFAASAAVITISVDGIESVDGREDADNTLLVIDLAAMLGTAAPVRVDAIGWDVGISSVGESWLSEATIGFEDSAGAGLVDLRPGIDDTFAGDASYTSGGLQALGELTFVLADGLLTLNFHETFDDVAGLTDAIWSGALSVNATPVPVPAAGMMLLSALGVLGLRRKT